MKKLMVCAAFIAAVGMFGSANAQEPKTKKCPKTEQCAKKGECKDAAKCDKKEACKDASKCSKDAKCNKDTKKECCAGKKEAAKK